MKTKTWRAWGRAGLRAIGLLLFISWASFAQQPGKLTNPLLPAGADPWSIYKDGWYYYTHTTGRNLTLWKTHNLADLAQAEKKVVWTPPPGQPYSKDVWAPELHFLRGKWYLYFAADDGHNRNHRLYVLENRSRDPLQGEWKLKDRLVTPDDRWAIDASVFEIKHQLYLLWSGWEGTENGQQNIYLCKLKNPWTAVGPRVLISAPTQKWEQFGDLAQPGPDDKPHINVNEGPEALVHGDRLFVVYSGSGCWTEHYALGMVYAPLHSNLLDPASWQKVPEPVFNAYQAGAAGTFAAGHHSFFRSPDGTEEWLLYHANAEAGQGCGNKRSPRAQRFTWGPDGMPQFGVPAAITTPQELPSEGRKAHAAHN